MASTAFGMDENQGGNRVRNQMTPEAGADAASGRESGSRVATTGWLSRNPPELDGIGGARVGIVGLGGLGSNIAIMLARAGVAAFRLADFDRVEPENLNRQHYLPAHIGLFKTEALASQLREINPDIELDLWPSRIEESDLFAFGKNCSVVVEAVDDAATKSMLIRWFLEHRAAPWLVTASGVGGIEPANSIRTVSLAERIVACGDFSTPSDRETGVCAPRVMLVASHQALAVLRILSRLDQV